MNRIFFNVDPFDKMNFDLCLTVHLYTQTKHNCLDEPEAKELTGNWTGITY